MTDGWAVGRSAIQSNRLSLEPLLWLVTRLWSTKATFPSCSTAIGRRILENSHGQAVSHNLYAKSLLQNRVLRAGMATDQGMSICTSSKSPPLVGAVVCCERPSHTDTLVTWNQLEFTDHLFIYTDYTQSNICILFATVVDDGGLKHSILK